MKVARPLYQRSSGNTSGRVHRRRTITAAQPTDDPDDQPPVIGDWREFKSRLITLDTADIPQDTSRQIPENMELLRAQNQYLAAEGIWASPSDTIAAGHLLLATPQAPVLSGDLRVACLVILILRHDSEGSEGVILNRPCAACMGDLRGWGSADDGRSPSQEPNDAMMGAFESCQVYLGGIYAPNRLIQQKSIFLHGQVRDWTLQQSFE